MKVSFIIPHYLNVEHLSELIGSIPNRGDVEVLIFNDGEQTVNEFNEAITDKLKDRNILCINSKENKGAGFARNELLKKAKGKYIIFADSDDIFRRDYLDQLINFLAEVESACDVVVFDVSDLLESEEGLQTYHERELKKSRVSRYKLSSLLASTGNSLNKDLIKSFYPPWGKAISRDLINEFNLQFSNSYYSNDILFSLRLYKSSNDIKVFDKPIYYVRTRDNSLTKHLTIRASKERVFEAIKYNKYALENRLTVRAIWMKEHVFNLLKSDFLGSFRILISHFLTGFNLMIHNGKPRL